MSAAAPGGVDALKPTSSSQAETYQRLRAHLATLKLAAAAEALTGVLDAAREQGLSLIAALERLLASEVDAEAAHRHAGLLCLASLPAPYTLEFDFTAQLGVDEKLIRELATLRFLDDAGNILLVGPPGTGKTMLAIGLARAAIDAGLLHHRRRPRQPRQTRRPRRPLGHRDALLRRRNAPNNYAAPSPRTANDRHHQLRTLRHRHANSPPADKPANATAANPAARPPGANGTATTRSPHTSSPTTSPTTSSSPPRPATTSPRPAANTAARTADNHS